MTTKRRLRARRKRLWRLVALLNGDGRGGKPLAGKSRARHLRELGRIALQVMPPTIGDSS